MLSSIFIFRQEVIETDSQHEEEHHLASFDDNRDLPNIVDLVDTSCTTVGCGVELLPFTVEQDGTYLSYYYLITFVAIINVSVRTTAIKRKRCKKLFIQFFVT